VPSNPTRLIRGNLSYAGRSPPVFAKARASRLSPIQALGVRYENRLHKALAGLAKELGTTLESNPWFKFRDDNGTGACSPDALLWLSSHYFGLIVEVKYTWVPTAAPKMQKLYLPVVHRALEPVILRSVIICKNLTPDSPKPIECLHKSMDGGGYATPVYQWLGQGPLCW